MPFTTAWEAVLVLRPESTDVEGKHSLVWSGELWTGQGKASQISCCRRGARLCCLGPSGSGICDASNMPCKCQRMEGCRGTEQAATWRFHPFHIRVSELLFNLVQIILVPSSVQDFLCNPSFQDHSQACKYVIISKLQSE